MNDTELHLHARIFRTGTTWYADIDDAGDPLPEDPYWYGLYDSQKAAIDAACTRIAALHQTQCNRLSLASFTRSSNEPCHAPSLTCP